MDIVKTLTGALDSFQTDRDQQIEIGVSSLGGCRAQAWHIINQTPKTNFGTENLAALMGTAIHSIIQEALSKYDLFGEDFILEQEINGVVKGHADFYSRSSKLLADWKTVTLKKLEGGFKPTTQQKWQVQTYAYMLNQAGIPVERVALVAIPRDGRKRDITAWESNYDEATALKALAWLEEVKSMSEPRPEKPAFFCSDYCAYYDAEGKIGCQGKK
jgi:Domain of unknown function DUF83